MSQVTNTQANADRVCPHCGTDRYKAQRADRRVARMEAIEADRERLARENGVLLANNVLARAEGEEVRRALQRKVNRQAKVIRRLERKLIELGKQPHEGVGPWEAAPVSDFAESER